MRKQWLLNKFHHDLNWKKAISPIAYKNSLSRQRFQRLMKLNATYKSRNTVLVETNSPLPEKSPTGTLGFMDMGAFPFSSIAHNHYD